MPHGRRDRDEGEGREARATAARETPDPGRRAIAVLVGGASRRMGRAKALLPRGASVTLLEHVVEVASAFAPVTLVGEPLFAVPPSLQGLPRVDDARRLAGPGTGPGTSSGAPPSGPCPVRLAGPLAGLLGAIGSDPAATWISVACDLPWLSREAIAWLLAERQRILAAAGGSLWAVVPTLDGRRLEPMLALWAPPALDRLERFVAGAGNGSRFESGPGFQALRGLEGLATPRVPEALARAWHGVNTPSEWRASPWGRADPGESPPRP